jgi:hypothetical protein
MALSALLANQNYAQVEGFYGDKRMTVAAGLYNLATAGVRGYGNPVHPSAMADGTLDYLLRRTLQGLPDEAWRTYVMDPTAPTNAEALQITADTALNTILEKGADGIDLFSLDEGQVSGEHLVMLLRCISPWEQELPGWTRALGLAKDALIYEGKDPEDALFGMI